MEDRELLMEALEAHEVIGEARGREDLEVLEREAKERWRRVRRRLARRVREGIGIQEEC